MFKKIISVVLALIMAFGCFSMAVNARQIGVGGGAESFCPIEFRQVSDVIGVTTVNARFEVTITDRNYKVKINSISTAMPFLEEGDTSNLTVSYSVGTVVEEAAYFSVTGHITASTNSVVRYTINYDILDKSGNTVWKNLTGYAYGKVSGSAAHTGAIGTVPPDPGDIGYGARFTSLDKLNSCYVQVPSIALNYELKTQHFLITFRERHTEVAVVGGNAPSTIRTYTVNWPSTQWFWQDAAGTWLMWAVPESGYYNFTVDMNANNEEWKEEDNTVVSTEMYYLSDYDKNTAQQVAEKMLALNKTFSQGYYVQKGRYTEESWNNFLSALDSAYQVAFAVPGANYGFKFACQNGKYADETLLNAFSNLQEAPCDWTSYKDPMEGEQPTCGSGGTQIFTCICGKTKVESTSLSECIPADEWTLTIEPTCTTKGEEAQLCTMCSTPVNKRDVDAIGHEYESEVVDPVCLEEGYTKYTCIRGDHTYNDDFTPAKGHTPGEVGIKYPTAINDGLKTVYCADCGDVVSTEAVDKHEGKFVFTMQSNDNTFLTSVTESDFTTTFTFPKGSVINTSGVTASISMTDIESLNVTDTITYENSITAETGKEIELNDALSVFESATLSGTVYSKDSMGVVVGKEYKYNLSSENTEESYIVKAIPENEENASVAFGAFTSHLTSEVTEERNSYLEIPGTAYIQVGTQKLSFENAEETYTFSDNEDEPELKLEETESLTDAQIEIFIPIGTVLAFGNLKITFNDFATIKLSGYSENEIVDAILSTLNNCQSNDEIIEELVSFVTEFATAINGNEVVIDTHFAPRGYVVSGTIESFVSRENSSATAKTVVELQQDGKRVQMITVQGDGVIEFAFEDVVPNGTYQVRVSKLNHVTRMYDITVDSTGITDVEFKIHLKGDTNGDGNVNLLDYSAVLRHVKKTKLLEGYAFDCADTDDSKVLNLLDYSAILKHVKKVSSLWR